MAKEIKVIIESEATDNHIERFNEEIEIKLLETSEEEIAYLLKELENNSNLKSIYDINTIEDIEELIKHREIERIFYDIFFVCDTDEKLEWLRNKLFSSIYSAYKQHKDYKDYIRNS